MTPDSRRDRAYSQYVFPKRKSTFVVVLAVLVVAGVLGLGEYLADVGDVLIWLLCALLLAALVRLFWRQAPSRLR
jgi:hypothetical protein